MSSTAVATKTKTTWAIDAGHSNVEFAVKHLMISTVRGRFSDVTGTIQLDSDDPANSTIDVAINVASIDTRQEQRDEHLRSADFFDAASFPTLTFKSTGIRRDSVNFLVDGDLTIRGVTKPMTLRATEEGRTHDPWGGERIGYSGSTKINRRDFGLTWNQVLEAGGFAVGDEVKITVDVELVKQ